MVVPVSVAAPTRSTSPAGSPAAKRCTQTPPSRCTSAVSDSESALTTLMPTPCSPPETL